MKIIEWSAFSVQLRRESKQKSGGFDCQALRGVGRGVAKGGAVWVGSGCRTRVSTHVMR